MEKEKIPYFVHESITMKLERTITRLWILCIIIFVSLVVSNAIWIYYVSQFDDIIVTQDNADGINSYVGDYNGDITINGETND